MIDAPVLGPFYLQAADVRHGANGSLVFGGTTEVDTTAEFAFYVLPDK